MREPDEGQGIDVAELAGLYVGDLSPAEMGAFNRACDEGRAYRSYTGAGGLMGLAKVASTPNDEARDEPRLSRSTPNDE